MTEYIAESRPTIIDLDRRMFLRIVLTGFFVGLATWGLTFVLNNYVLTAWFCSDDGSLVCSSSTIYAGNIAAVILAIVGISALVKLGVFRPLLIALASLITLWGVAGWLSSVSIIESILWTSILYGVSYITYAWLARIRRAEIMIAIVAIVVVASRLVAVFI